MTEKTQENMYCFSSNGRHMTICAQCGYRFVRNDNVLSVKETGDVIHKDCWMDYFDDNMEQFADETEF